MTERNRILVIGSRSDKVLNHFEAFIMSRGVAAHYIFIYEELFGKSIHVDDQGWTIEGRIIKHNQVGGVLNRLVALRKYGEFGSVYNNIVLFCNYLLDNVYPSVLNKPKDGMSNYSKLYQLMQIQSDCVLKPQSELLMNHFCNISKKQGEWIFKSTSSIRSRVTMLSKYQKRAYVWEPVLFQPYLKGDNIRVHVVGDTLVAHKCDSRAVDYRYAKTMISRYTLPDKVAESCIAITKQLKLLLSGIDLIMTKQGWVLLEVNTAPGFSYFEREEGEVSLLVHEWLNKKRVHKQTPKGVSLEA